MAADFAEDLHRAVADVLDAHGLGMLSRLVMVAELVDEDGNLNLIRGSCPADMPIWDELGQTPSGPPFGDIAADARVLFQVSSVGSTAEQASLMADKVRTAFMAKAAPGSNVFATPIPIAGCAVTDREVDREDGTTVASSTYTYLQRFALTVTTTGS